MKWLRAWIARMVTPLWLRDVDERTQRVEAKIRKLAARVPTGTNGTKE